MRDTVLFTAELFLHSSAETGKPCEYDVFEVSGYKIPMDLIVAMFDGREHVEWLQRAGVPVDRVARVLATAWFDDGDNGEGGYSPYWDMACTGWMDITPVEEKEGSA